VFNSIDEILKVPVTKKSIMNTNFVGLFTAGNSKTLLVPELAGKLKVNIPVKVIKSKYTCLGNLILCNDHGALVSPLLKKQLSAISKALEVKAEVGTIAGLSVVGSCGLANNQGCIVHPDIKKTEAEQIEKVLGVEVDRGTLNHGSPYVGACALANSKGVLVGVLTTSPELVRIEETLG
jgi:translation initiation factor 6